MRMHDIPGQKISRRSRRRWRGAEKERQRRQRLIEERMAQIAKERLKADLRAIWHERQAA